MVAVPKTASIRENLPVPRPHPRARILPGWLAALAASAVVQGANAPEAPYRWYSVTVGGGGFSPGLVFSHAERGLAYLRTDIGGLYRWDEAARRWIPLQDDMAESNYFGVESVAPDPVNPEVVYAAVGMYHWEKPTAMLRSADRGRHWEIYPVEFRMGGNEVGRGMGERLAVDANEPTTLYFGSRYDGLQRSVDGARSWSRLATFPLPGRGLPKDHADPDPGGISFVLPDPASGARGTRSRTLLIGVSDPGPVHLYRSDDAGESWRPLPGQPEPALLPVQGQLDARGVLYVTYANGIGPNGITDGAVYRFDTRAGTAMNITPEAGPTRAAGGYMGLAIDRMHPGTLLVATVNRWIPGDTLWRSSDDGRHWQSLAELSTHDDAATPYLRAGDKRVGFDHWMAGVAIDPFDPNHAAYTTGATVYATTDAALAQGSAASPPSLRWRPWVAGIEETAILSLASPPQGPLLLSGFGDISGFAHTDLDESPTRMFVNPVFNNTFLVDYAGQVAQVLVRTGLPRDQAIDGEVTLAWSDDSGENWHALKAPPLKWKDAAGATEQRRFDTDGNAPLIVSADGSRFIVMTPVPLLTGDRGKSWTVVHGLPGYTRIVADRVDGLRCYALDFAKGVLFSSSDGGASFSALATTGLPRELRADEPKNLHSPWPLIASPAAAGDLWYVSQGRLFHSINGGQHFELVRSGVKVDLLSFGMAPPGRTYPALFATGTREALKAIWRSDDAGVSWIRINDAQHEYGRRFRALSGDPRVFGRVYLGTDGRGILYGAPSSALGATPLLSDRVESAAKSASFVPSGPDAQVIYDDALGEGWNNWSWAQVTVDNAAPVHSGSASIAVTTAPYTALYLAHAPFNAGAFRALSFWIHGGAHGHPTLALIPVAGGKGLTDRAVPLKVSAGKWTSITVSMAELKVAGAEIEGFWIQNTSGQPLDTWYLDDVELN